MILSSNMRTSESTFCSKKTMANQPVRHHEQMPLTPLVFRVELLSFTVFGWEIVDFSSAVKKNTHLSPE